MIDKIKDFIKENSLLIVAILILFIMLKSCSSNRLTRRFDYTKQQYEYCIDSLNNVIDLYKIDIKHYNDSIYIVRTENDMLKDIVNDVKRDKEFYKKVNRDLVNVIGNETN